MKWFVALLSLLILSSCDGTPKINFDRINHDFGFAASMESLTTVFNFTNRGKGTLKILKVRAGWGCTGTLLSDRVIPAGGSGEIEITLKTGLRKGEMMKRIYVRSNDPEKQTVILLVRAFIEDDGKGSKRKSKNTASLKVPHNSDWLYKLLGYPRYTYR